MRYTASAPITSLTTSGSDGAVVSQLVNGDNNYLVVVNRDIDSTMTLTVSVDTTKNFSVVSKDGTKAALTSGTVSYTVAPADIVILNWSTPVLTPGDANGDGAVNVSDLSLLAANYGKTSGATWAMGDFTGDGAVNVSDLSLLAANYGTGSKDTLSWADAYEQAFGTTSDDANSLSDDTADDSEDTTSSVCSSLGLSLIAGLAMLGLMIVKLEE
jgi:hypothetical protein